jgi:3-oxoacyl-[acyl-carrier protein] reductase
MGQLQGKVAIVTGAAGGFGEGIAKLFVAEGAKVLIADLDEAKARGVAAALGGNAKAVKCDVSKGSDVQAAVKACVEAFGPPDIVVNNAGIAQNNQSMIEIDEATFDRIFNVNVKSIYHMAKAVIPVMRQTKKGGSIINIGSTAGIRPRPGLTWYNASKGAVNTVSKSMAVELGPDNIRVNAICPVMGATGLIGQFLGQDTPEARAKVTAGIPLGRLSTPEDIAAACLYLASDAGRFITGVELPVDGGRTI